MAGSLLASAAMAVASTSQICTRAPSPRKALAMARPMPLAPAVTRTRKPLMPRSMIAPFHKAGSVGEAAAGQDEVGGATDISRDAGACGICIARLDGAQDVG